jgi:hypothetical protein
VGWEKIPWKGMDWPLRKMGLLGIGKSVTNEPSHNQRACGVPSMQLFLNGAEGTILAERTALAGSGSKNRYLILELKQGPAT